MDGDTGHDSGMFERLLTRFCEVAVEEGLDAEKVGVVESRVRAEALAVAGGEAADADTAAASPGFGRMLVFATLAALAVKIPAFLGYSLADFTSGATAVYLLNIGFFTFPFVVGYFFTKDRPSRATVVWLAVAFFAIFLAVNLYPFRMDGHTQMLTSIHTPIALWLLTGVAFAGGAWRDSRRRMEYVRFSGETFLNWVLLCLGGGVLVALTLGVFSALGVSVESFVLNWMMPCGAAAAVVVAAWLADTRPGRLAPMLARVFTPLFTVLLVALLIAVVAAGGILDIDRDSLIVLDLLLVVVLALILYSLSSQSPESEPTWFDRMQLFLVGSTLIVDVVALASIVGRLFDHGFSPNRLAALGMNVVVLVALAGSTRYQCRYVRGREPYGATERWHMRYLPIYLFWVTIVALVFPVAFGWL